MTTDSLIIPPETARHVLWMFGHDRGFRPGTFTQYLIRAIETADVINRAKLQREYPDYAAAVDLAKNHEDGVARLQQAVERRDLPASPIACVRCPNTAGPFARRPDGPVCEDCLDDEVGQQ